MNKRGQFFLIAALIIAGIVLSLAAIYNFTSSREEDTQFYDLSSEIGFEGNKVLEHGVYSSQEIDLLIRQIGNVYSEAISEQSNSTIVFLYGDIDSMTQLTYETKSQGSIGIGTGGEPQEKAVYTTQVITGPANIEGNKVKINIADETYEFELKSGENFFIIIQKEKFDEKLVAAR